VWYREQIDHTTSNERYKSKIFCGGDTSMDVELYSTLKESKRASAIEGKIKGKAVPLQARGAQRVLGS